MRWLIVCLIAMALLLSGYALYKAKNAESAAKPQVRPVVAQVR